MKNCLSIVFSLFLLGAFVYAQEFGGIKGTVTDNEKNPLPGASVTLTGTKIVPMSVLTSEKGHFRFLSLPVAADYLLKIELSGFKTLVRENLYVSYNRDVILNLVLEMATLEENITVVAETPVIDTKRTQVGVNVTTEMIMSLPTARNPWTTLDLMPGMLLAQPDVGGNLAGQQTIFLGHGSTISDSTWNIDGLSVTEDGGGAMAYFDQTSYEELQINYGNNDVKSQTGGVQLNFVTKRGGNRFSGTFYLEAEDKAWQAENMTPALKEAGYQTPGINKIYLYGANLGGPIVKEKAWFFGSWGIRDIDVMTLAGVPDKTWLQSGYFKLDFQLTPRTKLGAFLGYDNKLKPGRALTGNPLYQGPETLWNQDTPTYTLKGDLEQMFGNLYLNLKALVIERDLHWQPVKGPRTADGSGDYMVISYYPSFYISGNIDDADISDGHLNINFGGDYFAEGILGVDHEFKFGVDYVAATSSSYDYYEGNLRLFYGGPAPFLPTGQWWEAWLMRDYHNNYSFHRYSAFVQDTVTFGRLALNIGLRYDLESSAVGNLDIPASPWLSEYMPAVKVDKIDPGVKLKTFSPRLSLCYDIFGNGKDVLKFSVARYGSQRRADPAWFINPVSWTEIDVFWQDLNGNGRVTSDELFGMDRNTGELKDPSDPSGWLWYSGVNPADPQDISPRNKIDPDYRSPLLDELTVSYEKEVFADFAARLEFFYKKNHRNTWDKGMLLDGTIETAEDYYLAGTDPILGIDYYDIDQFFPYAYRTNYARSYQRYVAGQIVLTKRLSKRWMMDASLTYSKWTQHWEGEYLDPTYQPYFDGQQLAPGYQKGGPAGLIGCNARWQFKLSGLYQLPFGLNLSGIFTAREGYILADYVLVYRPGIGGEWPLYGSPGEKTKFGDKRLPNFWMLNLRLEKVFALSEGSRVVLAVDAFNVTNSAHSLERKTQITAPNYGLDTGILNPRVFRFGVRFEF